jgi:hypothetical protein
VAWKDFSKPIEGIYSCMTNMWTTCGSYFNGGFTGALEADPMYYNSEVIKKFFRQLIPNVAEYEVITKYFDFTPPCLVLALFFKDQMYKTALALSEESIRKEDMDWENKVKITEDTPENNVIIKDRVGNKE